jgi:hypothetical protein
MWPRAAFMRLLKDPIAQFAVLAASTLSGAMRHTNANANATNSALTFILEQGDAPFV